MRLDRRVWLRLRETGQLLAGALRVSLNEGPSGVLARCRRRLREPVRTPEGAQFDSQFGVETAAFVNPSKFDTDSPNSLDAIPYQPISPKLFARVLERLTIDHSQFTFIDLGCGKGLPLLMASRYPFRKILGVEFARNLHAAALRNIASFRRADGACASIEVIHRDAADYEFPSGPLLIYFYNPFGEKVMSRVITRLKQSLTDDPRECWIIYCNSVLHHIFEAAGFQVFCTERPNHNIYRAGESTGRSEGSPADAK